MIYTKLNRRRLVLATVCLLVIGMLWGISKSGIERIFTTSTSDEITYPPTPTAEPTSVLTSVALVPGDSITLLSDVNYWDGSYVAPGTSVTKTWFVANNGTLPWAGYTLHPIFGRGEIVSVPLVHPGDRVEISAQVHVAVEDDIIIYQMADDNGLRFGEVIWMQTGKLKEVPKEPPTNQLVQGNKHCAEVQSIQGSNQAIKKGNVYTETWQLKNCGIWQWEEVSLVPVYGNSGIGSGSVKLPAVATGDTVSVTITTEIPFDWDFKYAHNVRELCFLERGTLYCFGQPLSTFWLLE